jgi:hypothetical protein
MFGRAAQRASTGMRAQDRPGGWPDDVVRDLLDDLEMQAGGLHLADRALEVEELTAAQYAEVDLLARLHASAGSSVRVVTSEGHDVRGRLAGVGSDWVLVDEGAGASSFVRLPYVVLLGDLRGRAVPAEALGLSARLSLRAVLRRLGEDPQPCAVHLRGGRVLHGSPERVGADFVELRQHEPAEVLTAPLGAVVVVRVRSGAGRSR